MKRYLLDLTAAAMLALLILAASATMAPQAAAHPGHGAAPSHGHPYNAAKRKAGKPAPRKPHGGKGRS